LAEARDIIAEFHLKNTEAGLIPRIERVPAGFVARSPAYHEGRSCVSSSSHSALTNGRRSPVIGRWKPEESLRIDGDFSALNLEAATNGVVSLKLANVLTR
jgi:hypothetical protein